jgi:hypothetical protein
MPLDPTDTEDIRRAMQARLEQLRAEFLTHALKGDTI